MLYQIQDKNGAIFTTTDFNEISKAWDINFFNDEHLEKKYHTKERDLKWLIPQWDGELQLVVIIEAIPCPQGIYKSPYL